MFHLNIYKALETQEKQDSAPKPRSATTIYDFSVKDTYDNDVCLDTYKGCVVLIVNIASRCKLTAANYKGLMELNQKYYGAGLRILCFPCNQFERGMPEQDGEQMMHHIKSNKANFGDVMKKIHVNGDHADPLFTYLKSKKGTFFGNAIQWNFAKFLIDKNGIPAARFSPGTLPTALGVHIEKLLKI